MKWLRGRGPRSLAASCLMWAVLNVFNLDLARAGWWVLFGLGFLLMHRTATDERQTRD